MLDRRGKGDWFQQVELPQLAELKQLARQIVELSNSYGQADDAASAQALLQLAAGLGQSYSASDPAITDNTDHPCRSVNP